jgi:TetR/AcrR family transcriptional regulator
MPRPSRKNLILETLAKELETNPGDRITTAGLARAVGVSEAALYRHFASKARMFEGLIVFAEEEVFARVNRILEDEKNTVSRCAKVLYLVLAFADNNAGITRVLLGDVLVGERERLLERVAQFFERLELQLRQILREAAMRNDCELRVNAEAAASLLAAYVDGRLHLFQRSGFKTLTIDSWEDDWEMLQAAVFA